MSTILPVQIPTIPTDDVLSGLTAALRAEPGDSTAICVFLDAYQERGATPEQAATLTRAAVGAGVAILDHAAMHARLVQSQIEQLERVVATAGRQVSVRYWANAKLGYLRRVGIVRVVVGADLRQTPMAGTVLIRPATSGKWGRSRANKMGRLLTQTETAHLLTALYYRESRCAC